VNVVHNLPEYQIEGSGTLRRTACTLEKVAPHLLDFLSVDNFRVNYTLVPYTGVSMIDFRFQLASDVSTNDLRQFLSNEITDGPLCGLYDLIPDDTGPEPHKFTPYSAVLISSGISVLSRNVYIPAYFDNENSVNRYFDVINHVCAPMVDLRLESSAVSS